MARRPDVRHSSKSSCSSAGWCSACRCSSPGIFRLRLIQRVNQVSSRALEILHADNWTARLEEGSAGSDLAELSGAVNRLLEAADASQQELRDSERRLAAQSQALTELTSRQTGVIGDGQRSAAAHPRDLRAHARGRARQHVAVRGQRRRRCAATTCFRAPPASTRRASGCTSATCRPISAPSATIGSSPPPTRTPIRGRASSATSYLTPNGIGAMLDVPLRQEDRGSACCASSTSAGRARGRSTSRTLRCRSPTWSSSRSPTRIGAQARAESCRERSARAPDPRYGARRVHRHGFRRPDRRRGTRRRQRRSAGRATKSSGGSWPRRSSRPASARRTSRACSVPRHRRGADRQPAARAARPAPRRPRVSDRDHRDHADPRRHAATSSARSCATSPSGCGTKTSCAWPRSPPKPRRAPRASSSPT